MIISAVFTLGTGSYLQDQHVEYLALDASRNQMTRGDAKPTRHAAPIQANAEQAIERAVVFVPSTAKNRSLRAADCYNDSRPERVIFALRDLCRAQSIMRLAEHQSTRTMGT